MGQDGIPVSLAILLSGVIMGVLFVVGMIVFSLLFGISMP